MFPAQIPKTTPDKFSRCAERSQSMDSGRRLSPIQKTDLAIKDSVYRAIWKDVVLRATDYHEIEANVKNGVVYLHGHLVSSSNEFRLMNAVRTIAGILAIQNHLVLDDKLI